MKAAPVPAAQIERVLLVVRDQKVMIDADLAALRTLWRAHQAA